MGMAFISQMHANCTLSGHVFSEICKQKKAVKENIQAYHDNHAKECSMLPT